MSTELIAGPATALAPDLAAQLVRAGSDVVMVTGPAGPGPHLIRHRVEGTRPAQADRLTHLVAEDTDQLSISGDRLWWLDDPRTGSPTRRARQATRLLERLESSTGSRLRHITQVLPHAAEAGATDAPLRALAHRHAVPLRRVRIPAVLSDAPDPGGIGLDAALALLITVEGRLRRAGWTAQWPVPTVDWPGDVPLAEAAAVAARLVTMMAAEESAPDGEETVAPEVLLPGSELWALLAEAAGGRVDENAPDPVSALIRGRFTGPDTSVTAATSGAFVTPQIRHALRASAHAIRERERNRRRAALAVASRLRTTELRMPDGGVLTLLRHDPATETACGRPPLVVVNALGQPVDCWFPLITELAPYRPVLLWQARGIRPDGHPVLFDEQIADVLAVLEQTGSPRCHLLGWCTGVKVSFAAWAAAPGRVASIVSLNASVKTSDTADEDDVGYERNLASLAQAVRARPAWTARLSSMFAIGAADEAPTDPGAALLAPGPALRRLLAAPFAGVEPLQTYCAQMLDFWRRPVWPGDVPDLPVLAVSAQYDQVVSNARARRVLADLPDLISVEIAGAGHQSLVDDAPVIAEHIEEFLISHD